MSFIRNLFLGSMLTATLAAAGQRSADRIPLTVKTEEWTPSFKPGSLAYKADSLAHHDKTRGLEAYRLQKMDEDVTYAVFQPGLDEMFNQRDSAFIMAEEMKADEDGLKKLYVDRGGKIGRRLNGVVYQEGNQQVAVFYTMEGDVWGASERPVDGVGVCKDYGTRGALRRTYEVCREEGGPQTVWKPYNRDAFCGNMREFHGNGELKEIGQYDAYHRRTGVSGACNENGDLVELDYIPYPLPLASPKVKRKIARAEKILNKKLMEVREDLERSEKFRNLPSPDRAEMILDMVTDGDRLAPQIVLRLF